MLPVPRRCAELVTGSFPPRRGVTWSYYVFSSRELGVLFMAGRRLGALALVLGLTTTSSLSTVPYQQIQRLVTWVREGQGSIHDSVAVEYNDWTGYGLRAAGQVKQGETLVSLPATCMLHFDDGNSPPPLLAIIDTVPEELWGLKLGLRLLHERTKGDASAFCDYMAMLPSGYTVPMFFGREEVAALQYPPLIQQVGMRGKFLHQLTTTQLQGPAAEELFHQTTVDMNALGWAFASVTSRAFRLRGPEHPPSLLPLIDLCNHQGHPAASGEAQKDCLGPNCRVLPGDGDIGARLVAERDLEANEALMINYGALSNDNFLLDYGFLDNRNNEGEGEGLAWLNPHDTVELAFSVAQMESAALLGGVDLQLPDGKAAPYQTTLLQQLGLLPTQGSQGGATLVRLGGQVNAKNGGVDPRLLAGTRVLASRTVKDLPASGRDLDLLGDFEKGALGRQGEVIVLRTLAALFASSLAAFPTSVDDDQALLNDTEQEQQLSANMRLAVRLRMGKKAILSQVIAEVGAKIRAALDEKKPDAAAATTGKKKPNTSSKAASAKTKTKGFG
jgi:hypothetical protein